MKFLPFKALIEKLNFRENDFRKQHIALLDDEEISWANYPAVVSKESMDAWKIRVRRVVLQESATVVLRTACGCEQVKDLTQKEELRGLLIPMMWTSSAMTAFKDSAEAESFLGNCREFRWNRRYHDNGAKIMEEVVRSKNV